MTTLTRGENTAGVTPKEVTRIPPQLVLFFVGRGTPMKRAPTHFEQIPVEVVKRIAVAQEAKKTVRTGSIRKPTSRKAAQPAARRSDHAGGADARYQRVRRAGPGTTNPHQAGAR
jgi:hypothetical protein